MATSGKQADEAREQQKKTAERASGTNGQKATAKKIDETEKQRTAAEKTAKGSKAKAPRAKSRKRSRQITGLIDTHCHLHEAAFYTTPMALDCLHRAARAGVKRIVCIGTSLEDSFEARRFAFEVTKENAIRRSGIGPMDMDIKYTLFPEVSWTFGVHPEAATDLKTVRKISKECKEEIDDYFRAAYASNVSEGEISVDDDDPSALNLIQIMPLLSLLPVAIGEVGLDYHYEKFDRIAQIRLLEEMLQIANKYDLPVSFHVRQAFEDFFPIVANFPKLRGVVHSFSDNKKNLRRILEDTQFYVGVNGMATYSTLPTPPLERTLLETDAPFLTPKKFRGIINEPSYVKTVAEWLAEKLGVEVKEIERETSKNARRLFGFHDS